MTVDKATLNLREKTYYWLAEVINLTAAKKRLSYDEMVIPVLEVIDQVVESITKEEDGTLVIDIYIQDVFSILRKKGLKFKTKPTFLVLLEVRKIMDDREALLRLLDYL